MLVDSWVRDWGNYVEAILLRPKGFPSGEEFRTTPFLHATARPGSPQDYALQRFLVFASNVHCTKTDNPAPPGTGQCLQ